MRVAQLVERCLAKAKVAGSIPVSHSKIFSKECMKSFLSQGKTIGLAIEKAIELANYPVVFTIKIVENGNKSIFWWLCKDAVIVFSYEDNVLQSEKKIYAKKNVFLHKNHSFHDEPSVTSVMQQSKRSGIRKKSSENMQSTNVFDEQPDNKRVQKKEGFVKKECVKLDVDDKKKSALTKKYECSNSYCAVKKKNICENKNVDIIKKNFEEKLIEKQIYNNDDLQKGNDFHLNNKKGDYTLWNDDHVKFIQKWIESLNSYMYFTEKDITYRIDNKKLIITISELDSYIEKEKKHFYSSVVLLLYQAFQNHFNIGFIYDNDYKIIIE